MELQGKKLAVLVEDQYEDQELWYPYYRLQEAGAAVDLLGTGKDGYASKNGHPCQSDYKIDNAISSNYDGVVIPGGYAPDKMRRHEPMVQFVRDIDAEDKMVAAICHAGWMLISAGIVQGRQATSFFSIRDDMVNAGAEWVDREVVQDGNLITSRSPEDLPAFLRTIIEALGEA